MSNPSDLFYQLHGPFDPICLECPLDHIYQVASFYGEDTAGMIACPLALNPGSCWPVAL
jgi:hypothetical protein